MTRRSARAPTTPHPVSMASLARRVGVARSSITRLARGRLRAAVLPGGRLDAAHAEVRRWARERGIDPRTLLDPVTARGTRREAPAEEPTTPAAREVPLDELPGVAALLDLTVREATQRFGSAQGARDWVALRRAAAEVARIEARTLREAGLLISREIVRTHVFGALDGLSRRLLSDMSATLATRLAAPTLTREERVLLIQREVTNHLVMTRDAAIRGLRAAVVPGDHQPPLVQEPERRDDVHRDALRREILRELGDLVPATAGQIASAFPGLTDLDERRRVVTAALAGMVRRAEQITHDRERQAEAAKELHRDDDET